MWNHAGLYTAVNRAPVFLHEHMLVTKKESTWWENKKQKETEKGDEQVSRSHYKLTAL